MADVPQFGVPRDWIIRNQPDWFGGAVDRAADAANIPRQMFYNMLWRENGTGAQGQEYLRPTRSRSGAEGFTQMIPGTARAYDVQMGTTRAQIESQLNGGARYMNDLAFNTGYGRSTTVNNGNRLEHPDWGRAVGGYIAGPQYDLWVRGEPAPLFRSTSQNYVLNVMRDVPGVDIRSLPQRFQDLPQFDRFTPGSTTLGIGSDDPIPILEERYDASGFTPISADDFWNRYAGSPDIVERDGVAGYYGTTAPAPFYRITNEQAGWMAASPAADQPIWNPLQNSYGYFGEPPMDLFPTGRLDLVDQAWQFSQQNPGVVPLWDLTPQYGYAGPGSGGQSWFSLFNPVGTAHAGVEPLPPFLQDWDVNFGRGSQGPLSVFSPNQILQQWDFSMLPQYGLGDIETWDASGPHYSTGGSRPIDYQHYFNTINLGQGGGGGIGGGYYQTGGNGQIGTSFQMGLPGGSTGGNNPYTVGPLTVAPGYPIMDWQGGIHGWSQTMVPQQPPPNIFNTGGLTGPGGIELAAGNYPMSTITNLTGPGGGQVAPGGSNWMAFGF